MCVTFTRQNYSCTDVMGQNELIFISVWWGDLLRNYYKLWLCINNNKQQVLRLQEWKCREPPFLYVLNDVVSFNFYIHYNFFFHFWIAWVHVLLLSYLFFFLWAFIISLLCSFAVPDQLLFTSLFIHSFIHSFWHFSTCMFNNWFLLVFFSSFVANLIHTSKSIPFSIFNRFYSNKSDAVWQLFLHPSYTHSIHTFTWPCNGHKNYSIIL